MSIHIRNAVATDLPALLEIVNQAILNTTAIYDYEPRTMAEQEAWFKDKTDHGFAVLVAETDGKIAGFSSYGTFKAKIGYRFTAEHSVYVAEGFHGKGTGSLLLQELIAVARQNGLHTLIGYVDSENGGSIAFHRKFGFEEAGLLREVGFKFGRQLDVLLMQLILK